MSSPSAECIMINDMLPNSPPLTPGDLKQLQELTRHRIDRRKAELWAHTQMKFLVYDDTAVRERGWDSDDEEGMLEYVTRLSLQEANGASRESSGEVEEKDVEEVERDADSNVEPYCRSNFCSIIPPFPTTFPPRKFRIVQPKVDLSAPTDNQGGPSVCSHYIAVSYCWPVPNTSPQGSTVPSSGSYQIRHLDGTVRKSRAPDDVLDRAVAFAISKGMNMIWIDQECLPQPTEHSPQHEKEEQQLGVQAMDIVYNRAAYTCGLLAVEIKSRVQLHSIATMSLFRGYAADGSILYRGRGPQPSVHTMRNVLQEVLNFLETMGGDRWYTRAWVAQEALLAGDMLRLLVHADPSMDMEIWDEMAGDSGSGMTWTERSTRAQEEYLPRIVRRSIEIPVAAFQDLLLATVHWNEELEGSNGRGAGVLRVARCLHPIAPKPRSLAERLCVPGGVNYRERQTVDAAGALAGVTDRGCRDVQDRIAILANMCNFENRLDTSVLAKCCTSLRLGYLALTLLNGDYSLLVPESYALDLARKQSKGAHGDENVFPDSSGWLYPFGQIPQLLQVGTVYPAGFIRRSIYKKGEVFTTNGIKLHTALWLVEDKIDLTIIQREWASKWDGIQTLEVVFPRKVGETNEEYDWRRSMLTEGNIRGDETQWKDILAMTRLQGHFIKEGDFGYELHLEPPQVIDPSVVPIIAEIVFAILRHLFLNADEEPRAIGLANSIWHSVRIDVAGNDAGLPDDVGEWLFSDPNVDHNPSSYLQLDERPDGSFHQCWFIDRIMKEGFLRVGNCESAPHLDGHHDSALATGASSFAEGGGTTSKKDSILDQQMQYRISAGFGAISTFNTYVKSTTERVEGDYSFSYGREVASMVRTFARRERREESEHGGIACARNHVSVFDVDGPCIVAVPYNGDWERLPRPVARSMSVCWIVDCVRQRDKEDGEDASSDAKSVNVLESAHNSLRRYQQMSHAERLSGEGDVAFRLLGKVRGLWKINLDQPDKKCTFMY